MAIQQGTVTFTGYMGNEPTIRGPEGNTVATFRVASTRRYLNRAGVWVECPTTWLTVKAFRALADHVRHSLHKGDPVIVAGVLNTDQWTGEQGEPRTAVVLEATNIGHDLNFGVSTFRRFEKPKQQTTSKAADPFESAEASQPAQPSQAPVQSPSNQTVSAQPAQSESQSAISDSPIPAVADVPPDGQPPF